VFQGGITMPVSPTDFKENVASDVYAFDQPCYQSRVDSETAEGRPYKQKSRETQLIARRFFPIMRYWVFHWEAESRIRNQEEVWTPLGDSR
jgi:hypothetical protein